MATTSIWPIKNRVSVVIDYARNPEKTVDKNLTKLASLHKIGGVIEYAADAQIIRIVREKIKKSI